MNVTRIMKISEKFVSDNAPAILTGIGVIGTAATAYLTGKATVQAVKKIEEKKFIKHLNETATTVKKREEPLDKLEIVKLTWTCYIPPVASAAITIGSIVMANRINTKRAAAMALAYSASQKTIEEYKEKVVEKFGKNKEQQIRDDIAQDTVDRNPVGKNEVIITGGGEVLCYDKYTGRYFMSSMETLKRAENEMNFNVLNNNYAYLNDFYRYIGLPTVPMGEEVGWMRDMQFILDISTTISENQKPCLVVEYHVCGLRQRPSKSGLKAVNHIQDEEGHPIN